MLRRTTRGGIAATGRTAFVLIVAAAAALIAADPLRAQDARHLPSAIGRELTAEEAHRDIAAFREIVRGQWLLSNVNDADFDAAIDALEVRARDGMTVADLTIGVQRILAMGADGHAEAGFFRRVLGMSPNRPPFSIEPVGDRYVAVDSTNRRRNQLWQDQFPYITAIDGVGIEKWVESAMEFSPRSHPLSQRTHAAAHLRYLGYFRKRLGLEDKKTISVTLESENGERHDVTVKADSRGASWLRWNEFPRPEWKILEGNIGYIWLDTSAADTQQLVLDVMPRLRHTEGLVLDLRGNEGGAGSDVLQILGCYLTNPENPRQFAFTRRIVQSEDPGVNAPAYQPTSPELTAEGRSFAQRIQRTWRSEWSPPAGIKTHDWYNILASPEVEPDIYFFQHPKFPQDTIYAYRKPVVVLIDRHCFSAAESIAAGLATLPQVTLIGEPTRGGGGSPKGRPTLPESQMPISLVTRNVKLTVDGHLIDGRGVIPDIHVDLDVATLRGTQDSMLDAAMRVLKTGGR